MTRYEFLAIGNELLDGRVTDTNSVRLGQALTELGNPLQQRSTVIDEAGAIHSAIEGAVKRQAKVVVVSGGLGPTSDDITARTFAEFLQVELVRDEEVVRQLKESFAARGYPFTDNQLQQADRPAGAQLIKNPRGTAPGFSLVIDGCRFISLPGVPREFDVMVEGALLEGLRHVRGPRQTHHLRTFGLGEGEADSRLAPVHERWPLVELGFRAHFPELHIKLAASEEGLGQLAEATVFARQVLGSVVFSDKEQSLPETVVETLTSQGRTIAAAESCTGGLISHLLTQVSGSSAVFLGGMVTYHNDAKMNWLDVPSTMLEEHGAVSREVVCAMAEAVRLKAGAAVGVATSGVAGPGGATADKPVGTIWIATSTGLEPGAVGRIWSKCLQLPFGRRGNQSVSAYAVLAAVLADARS